MHQKDEWQCSPGLGLRTSSQVLLTGLMVCHCLSFIAHKSLTILDCIPKGSHTEPTPLLFNSPRSYIKRLIFSHDITGVGCTTMVSKKLGSVSFTGSEKSYSSGKYQDWFCLLLPVVHLCIMPHFPFHHLFFSVPGLPVVPFPSLCHHTLFPDSAGAA